VQAISSGPLPSSQLFKAFVGASLAHKVARKRRSIDKLDAEDACIA
jgi:hypothetical protein